MDREDTDASPWGDVFSPNSSTLPFDGSNSLVTPIFKEDFSNLSINNEYESPAIGTGMTIALEDGSNPFVQMDSVGESNFSEDREQHDDFIQHEIEHEERNQHKKEILSALTSGSDEHSLENSLMLPQKLETNENLFNDSDSPLNFKISDSATKGSDEGERSKQINFKPLRRKYNSETVLKKLGGFAEADNPLGPLADSGDSNNEDSSSKDKRTGLMKEIDAPLYTINSNSPKKEVKDTSDKSGETTNADIENSLKKKESVISQLEISVGDPIKVGDITNAHIVYSIKTKNKNASSTWFPSEENPYVVSRRYKDFRWIYHQLQSNHPGRIIPPPPSKQTYIGRFNESFIENRRLSLEKMLNKISCNPNLYNDQDFIMFLTASDFAAASSERESASGSGASLKKDEYLDSQSASESDLQNSVVVNSGGGFMSSIFSLSQKVQESDETFAKKKEYIENLEHNLRVLYKSLEAVAAQKVDLSNILDEVSITVDELAAIEFSKSTDELLSAFSGIQQKLKENEYRSNLQDQLTLAFTIEEYLRIIGSIKYVFETRSQIYQQLYSFEQEYNKKKSQLEKLKRKVSLNPEKINLLTFETEKLQQKVATFDKSYKNISQTILLELDDFESGKIEEFRNSVEIYIESSIESQKEAIELWETFYEQYDLSDI